MAPESGTYYVWARHWNPNIGECGTRYDLVFAEGDVRLRDRHMYLPLVRNK